ncbi:MAG TPA: hypothetical protein VG713_22590 [Pirellulales bacterium]|nr:hypothetical protein [Pirellulales bacterium]
MAAKAGVWIDHKQAIVVLITAEGHEVKKVKSGLQQSGRRGGPSSKHKYTPNDFIAEDRRERKLVDNRKELYEAVLAYIRGADSLLILGPGEAKGEFMKHIKSKKLRGLAVELGTTDKLTDRQLVAKVGEHFDSDSSRKPVTRKKMKKATKARVGKRTTKARK